MYKKDIVMNIKTFIYCFIAVVIVFCGCNKKEKFVDSNTGEKVSVKIKRFDKALFETKHSNIDSYLDSIRKDYSDILFSPELDKSIKELVADTVGQLAWKAVKKYYNDLSPLESSLTTAFANLQKYYPDTELPKFYTMIAGPARFEWGYANRVFAMDSCVVIALDWYSVNDNTLNNIYCVPKYLLKVLDSSFIAVDIMKNYLLSVTTVNIKLAIENPDADLLALMIETGKFDYAAQKLLDCDDKTALRYSNEEWQWCEKNEDKLWGYIVQNKLLFEKDRQKFMGILNDAPSSKGIENSPGRIAEYIGFKIVKQFAERKRMKLSNLFLETDANKILKESYYKPKK
jgi:hypothetical protein